MPSGIYKHNKLTKIHKQNIGLAILGKKHTKKSKLKMGVKGKIHWNWKGEKAKYFAKHEWLRLNHGNATKCENREKKIFNFVCNEKSRIYHWAKKKSKSYAKKIENYYQLCASCHAIYDGKGKNQYENKNT
jgi:hypothetical protein